MLKILCPTDFSPNSEFAIAYAIDISNKLEAKLIFISSFKVPRVAGSLRALDDKINEALNEDLLYFVNKFRHLIKSGIEPELAVVQGNTTDSILYFAQINQVDLIVMGTKGSSGVANMVLGSITRKFFEKTNIPVLAIPYSAKEQLAGNTILLSLDAKGINNVKSIALLKQLKKLPEAKLDVFHVTIPLEEVKLDINTGKIGDLVNKIVDVEGIDPVAEIKQYAERNEIRIIAMVGRKHSFWERLFFESNSVSELFATNIPVLLLPE
jgi:nucleotide-binding universal stress UspA family protein